MTGRRIANTLPVGATVEDLDKTVWTKTQDKVWEDDHGEQRNNAAIDTALAGGGEIVRQVVNVDTEQVKAPELEAGEYVVLSFGFWFDGQVAATFTEDEYVAQQLWRVAGWVNTDPRYLTVLLDAPEDQLRWVNHLICPERSWETRAMELWVDPAAAVRVVLPGQDHQRWDDRYDWTCEFTLVDPPV